MRKFIVGVMGAGEGATKKELHAAFRLGELIAREGWVLLSGGRNAGVMQEASRGAKKIAGSLTIGILPTAQAQVSKFVDVAIITDMGNARNNINVLSSDVVIACGAGGAGTVSEIALALKNGKPVVLLSSDAMSRDFFARLNKGNLFFVETAEAAIAMIQEKIAVRKSK
jgi:uncharacterized protein (TIGR00725 family)